MPEIKWQRLVENQCWRAIDFIVLSYSRNGYSKDFLMYDHDQGEFLVVLVICRCVNAMEATMEAARSIKEDGCEVYT